MSDKKVEAEALPREAIVDIYPSLCWDCKNSRKTWSTALQDDGYCGCCAYVKYECSWTIISDAEEIAEGWVDLRANPFSKGSGITSNCQLITKRVKKCEKFSIK